MAYSLINLYRIVDLLDLSNSYNFLRFSRVSSAQWQAGTLLTVFKTFFTLVLVQQIFASIRQGQALAESITDFWSPHPPIHERARNSLPQRWHWCNPTAAFVLRMIESLTKEQRDQLPKVIASIGPGSIPALIDHLNDAHEGVRAVAATALGLLHALDSLPALVELTKDPSEIVRQEAVVALGIIGGPGIRKADKRARVADLARPSRRHGWFFGRRGTIAKSHEPERVKSRFQHFSAL